MRGGEGKELRMCAGARVSLLHTRDRVTLLTSRPSVPGFIVSARMHRYRRTPIVSLFSRPPFALSCLSLCVLSFFFFLFFYDNHPIQLCPFETMAQVRRSHA